MVGTIELLRPQCAAHSAGAGNIGITTLLQALLVSQCELTASQLWPKDYGSHYIDKGKKSFIHSLQKVRTNSSKNKS